jgi:hypothetical protein
MNLGDRVAPVISKITLYCICSHQYHSPEIADLLLGSQKNRFTLSFSTYH